MIEIQEQPVSPEVIGNKTRGNSYDCLVTYVGVIGNDSTFLNYNDMNIDAV
jgi:hypothetical protein